MVCLHNLEEFNSETGSLSQLIYKNDKIRKICKSQRSPFSFSQHINQNVRLFQYTKDETINQNRLLL